MKYEVKEQELTGIPHPVESDVGYESWDEAIEVSQDILKCKYLEAVDWLDGLSPADISEMDTPLRLGDE